MGPPQISSLSSVRMNGETSFTPVVESSSCPMNSKPDARSPSVRLIVRYGGVMLEDLYVCQGQISLPLETISLLLAAHRAEEEAFLVSIDLEKAGVGAKSHPRAREEAQVYMVNERQLYRRLLLNCF